MTLSASDILDAVHNEAWNTDLEIGSFEVDYSTGRFGMPSFRMGASWMVVIAETNSRRYALRIPKTESAKKPVSLDKLDRISRILDEKKPDWFPNFRLVRDALTVNGEQLPVVVMPFIGGCNFSKYVAENRENQKILYDLIAQLQMLENNLLREGFDHGDISVRNLLVDEQGKLMLIDPDALHHSSCSISRSIELGCSSINHPLRTARDIGPGLCIFPIRLITLILHTLIKDPLMIDASPDPQAFFFDEKELTNPSSSHKWKRVKKLVNKKQSSPILTAISAPSLKDATEILRPDIHKFSRPMVVYTIAEMLDIQEEKIKPQPVKPMKRHHRKMRPLPLNEEFKISNANKSNGDGQDVE